jgi:hypothetical protein
MVELASVKAIMLLIAHVPLVFLAVIVKIKVSGSLQKCFSTHF